MRPSWLSVIGFGPTGDIYATSIDYDPSAEASQKFFVAYLEFAEVQALNDFLRLGGRDVLTHAGAISHEQAVLKAEAEFERFHRAQLAEPSQAEKDFEKAVKDLKRFPAPRALKRKK